MRFDFFCYRVAHADMKGFNACFFRLGVSAVSMSESAFHRMTCGQTISAAAALADLNPELTFCYVSGEGIDSTERAVVPNSGEVKVREY